MEELIRAYAQESIAVKQDFFDSQTAQVVQAAELIIASSQSGGKVLLFGNGGSAADAQHLAAELVNRLSYERPPIAAIALTTDSSILTSVGNDASFDELFERQVRALGRPGDVAIAISTSGNSRNIIRAVEAAREMKINVIAFTGRGGGKLAPLADVALTVAADNTQHIQETHITVGHILCELVQGALYPSHKTNPR